MSRSISIARTAVLVVVALTGFSVAAIDLRKPAPRFNAKTLEGERFTNETLKGNVVLLQFWTTWCRYCRSDQDAVDSLVEDFESKGLVILAVNVGESRKKVKTYLEHAPRACKIVLTGDTNLAAMFAASSFPLYVLIDREGKIAGRQQGAAGESALRRMVARVGLEAE